MARTAISGAETLSDGAARTELSGGDTSAGTLIWPLAKISLSRTMRDDTPRVGRLLADFLACARATPVTPRAISSPVPHRSWCLARAGRREEYAPSRR